jgi:hypothetical protein
MKNPGLAKSVISKKTKFKRQHVTIKWAGKTINCCTGSAFYPALGYLFTKFRCEKSFFGYDPSILKSGMQKYARRNEVEKGLWCLIEMDLFSLLEKNGPALDAYLSAHPNETRANTQAAAKRIRTNMVNRLVVMMSEEVSISAWWMPSKILELYENWMENRNHPLGRKFLVDKYLSLTSQKMIRLISDIHSVYLVPPSYVKPGQMDDLNRIHQEIQVRYPKVYSGQAEVGAVKWGVDLGKHPSKIQPCIEGILYNLEKGSDNVFFWIRKLFELELEDGVCRYKYVKIVWDILHRFIDINREYEFVRETICALRKFHKMMTHREKPIYLYHAVLLLVRRNEIDWSLKDHQIDTPLAEVDRLYRHHLRDGRMEMDEYVMDLHTRKMRWTPKCYEKFAREGAYVKNEDIRFLNQEYREIYVLLKQEKDLFRSRGGKIR